MKIDKNYYNFFWNVIGTTISSFNSLFFLIIATRINGVNDAGIFTFAFSLACLFYTLGVYSGRTYQVTENNPKLSDSDYFYSKFITCLLALLISFIYCIIRSYSFYKVIIIMSLVLFKICESISESIFAVFQKDEKLYMVGKSLFLKAIFGLVIFTIIDYFTKNLIISCISIFIVNFIFIIFYDIKNLKSVKFKFDKFNKENTILLLKKGFYSFGFMFLTLYVINTSKYVIDFLSTNEFQTIFGIISMPATILILFAQYLIQPFLTQLKLLLKTNLNKFITLIIKLTFALLVFGILVIVLVYFFGIPVLELMYNLNLKKYLLSLIIIIIGAIVYASSVIFSTALTTMRSTFSQFCIYLVTSIFASILSFILIKKYSIIGACYSYSLSMLIMLMLYIIVFIYKIRDVRRNNHDQS